MATSIRLSPEIEKRLALLASQTGRTKAFYVREIIERGIEDAEDYYLAADVLDSPGALRVRTCPGRRAGLLLRRGES